MRHILIPLAALALLASCAGSRHIADTSLQHDTLHVARERAVWHRDTVVVRDSAVTLVRGDTVWVERWHRHDRVSLRHDTLWRDSAVVRTIQSTHTVTLPRPLSWWQRLLQSLGLATLLTLVLLLLQQHLRR